jgi:TolA-binding protein
MSALDIHPEELIDKLEAGTLAPAERTRLDAHLAACDVCRFELALRRDLDDDLGAVGRAPGRVKAPAPERAQRASGVTFRPSWSRRLRRWVTGGGMAAALFVLAAVSFAAYAAHAVWVQRSGESAAARVVETPGGSQRATLKTPEMAPASKAPSQAASAAPLDVRALPLEPPSSPEAAAATPSAATHGPSAAALFSDANSARHAGDSARAIALYRTLARRYPKSQEATLSHVLVARVLSARDPAGALAEFDAYLAGGASSLSAEAWVGRARALAALGRDAESRAAWQEVLARYPGSVYADEARSTLGIVRSP